MKKTLLFLLIGSLALLPAASAADRFFIFKASAAITLNRVDTGTIQDKIVAKTLTGNDLINLTLGNPLGTKGDVNGDGRMDILEKTGWWEQPASLAGDPVWRKHEAMFGNGGAQIYAYDVNGDGKNDVITSIAAHEYGLAWFEQTNDGGVEGWTKHMIIGEKAEDNGQGIAFSQLHAIDLIDMNGDGLKDIVTGKRFYAHGSHGDPDPTGTPYLYWFELKREGKDVKFTAHLIDDASGVGTQVTAGDINGDGKPDVVVGNKRGAFVFLQK